MSIRQIKKKATVQTAFTQTLMKKNSRNSSRCRPRWRIWVMRIQSASADSAGQQMLAKITHYLVRANAQAPSVKFITNAYRHGWRPASSQSCRATSIRTSGRPSSVRFANHPILLWWKRKVTLTTLYSTKNPAATTWCSNHSVKRRTPLELSTSSDHPKTKRFSSLVVVTSLISELTISLSHDATRRSSLSAASSC